jgi:hypothetical protein
VRSSLTSIFSQNSGHLAHDVHVVDRMAFACEESPHAFEEPRFVLALLLGIALLELDEPVLDQVEAREQIGAEFGPLTLTLDVEEAKRFSQNPLEELPEGFAIERLLRGLLHARQRQDLLQRRLAVEPNAGAEVAERGQILAGELTVEVHQAGAFGRSERDPQSHGAATEAAPNLPLCHRLEALQGLGEAGLEL